MEVAPWRVQCKAAKAAIVPFHVFEQEVGTLLCLLRLVGPIRTPH